MSKQNLKKLGIPREHHIAGRLVRNHEVKLSSINRDFSITNALAHTPHLSEDTNSISIGLNNKPRRNVFV